MAQKIEPIKKHNNGWEKVGYPIMDTINMQKKTSGFLGIRGCEVKVLHSM